MLEDKEWMKCGYFTSLVVRNRNNKKLQPSDRGSSRENIIQRARREEGKRYILEPSSSLCVLFGRPKRAQAWSKKNGTRESGRPKRMGESSPAPSPRSWPPKNCCRRGRCSIDIVVGVTDEGGNPDPYGTTRPTAPPHQQQQQ